MYVLQRARAFNFLIYFPNILQRSKLSDETIDLINIKI